MNCTILRKTLFLIGLAVVFSGCRQREAEKAKEAKAAAACGREASVPLPAFDADSAFGFVKAQTDFGPRVPATAAHAACRDYLLQKLNDYCDTVLVQNFTAATYDGQKIPSSNLIGVIAPEKSGRVVLAAHWDSRPVADHDPDPANRNTPIDGANDGASGVGVLLEMARQWQTERPEIGIDIVFFDIEDYGPPSDRQTDGDWWGLGSQYWAENPHTPDYKPRYGILLDMVGSPDPHFLQEGFSSRFAQELLSKVWATAFKLGYRDHFVNAPGHFITDDHYYVNTLAGIPMIDIIHLDPASGTGFDPVWHTLDDNIGHVDKNTLGMVGRTLLQVIKEEK